MTFLPNILLPLNTKTAIAEERETEEILQGSNSDTNLDKVVLKSSIESEERQSESEDQDPRPRKSIATSPRKRKHQSVESAELEAMLFKMNCESVAMMIVFEVSMASGQNLQALALALTGQRFCVYVDETEKLCYRS